MSNYLFLSHILNMSTPSYGNRDRIEIFTNTAISNGKTANTSVFNLSNNHIGTHIDVPRHFSDSGKRTYDYPIKDYVFKTPVLVDIPCLGDELLGADDFVKLEIISDVDILLIRTGFENFRGDDIYWKSNPGLAPELADWLRAKFPHLRCVGFDFISVTSWTHRDLGKSAHQNFLTPFDGKREIWIIEDMALKAIKTTLVEVIVAPIFMEGGNGGTGSVIAKVK